MKYFPSAASPRTAPNSAHAGTRADRYARQNSHAPNAQNGSCSTFALRFGVVYV